MAKIKANDGVTGRPRQSIRWTLFLAGEEFGIDYRSLKRVLHSAQQEPGVDGKYSTKQIVSAIFGDISGEKLRKTRAEADLLELQLGIERGQVIPAGVAERLWSDVTQAIKAVILASGLSELERDELFSKLREIPDVEYRKERTNETQETKT